MIGVVHVALPFSRFHHVLGVHISLTGEAGFSLLVTGTPYQVNVEKTREGVDPYVTSWFSMESGGGDVSCRVKEVSDLAGVSVRTLHHYDQIGLLKPQSVSEAGYRLYSDEDLARLQQILLFKELGFGLRQTKAIIDSLGFDRVQALEAQKGMLVKQRDRLNRLVATVEKTIELLEEGAEMTKKEMFEAFDMSEIEEHQKKYAREVEEKYGGSAAYEESKRKTEAYGPDDWARIMKRSSDIFGRIADMMDSDPADPKVQKAVEDWRQHITESFYTCTPEILRGLGEMYVADDRFTRNIDKVKPGLAQFLSEAIRIHCDSLDGE